MSRPRWRARAGEPEARRRPWQRRAAPLMPPLPVPRAHRPSAARMIAASVMRLAFELGGDPPGIEDEHAVAEMDELGDLGRMEQDRAARLGESAHQQIELVLGADIDAAGRVEQKQDAALGQQPFGDRDLLLVAAGEGAGPRPERAAVDLDAVEGASTAASRPRRRSGRSG